MKNNTQSLTFGQPGMLKRRPEVSGENPGSVEEEGSHPRPASRGCTPHGGEGVALVAPGLGRYLYIDIIYIYILYM